MDAPDWNVRSAVLEISCGECHFEFHRVAKIRKSSQSDESGRNSVSRLTSRIGKSWRRAANIGKRTKNRFEDAHPLRRRLAMAFALASYGRSAGSESRAGEGHREDSLVQWIRGPAGFRRIVSKTC